MRYGASMGEHLTRVPVTFVFIHFVQPRAASSCKLEVGSGMSGVRRPWTEVGMNSLSCPAGSLHASFLCLQEGEPRSDRGAVDAWGLVPVSLPLCCRSMGTLRCRALTAKMLVPARAWGPDPG